ncbi:MAG: metal-binding protein [Cyanobacteria bacterium P01_D01_bin.1]
MPAGRTHDQITLWCLPFVTTSAFGFTYSLPLTVIVSLSFLVGGFMLGPDLDIRSVQYVRWGPLRWIWLPYQIAIKHRSQLSHGPIVGTALRVAYLSVWLSLFAIAGMTLLNVLWDAQLTWQTVREPFQTLFRKYLFEWLAVVIGLELGSISHSVSDAFGSQLSSRKRSRKRREKERNNKHH